MRFACDKCSSRFSIADEKIRGKRVAVRCSHCGERIVLDGGTLATPSSPGSDLANATPMPRLTPSGRFPAATPPGNPPVPDGWYYVAAGKTTGPLSATELRARVDAGAIGPRTFLWRDGQGDWKRASDLPAIGAMLARAAGVRPPTPAPVAAPPPPPLDRTEPEPEDAGNADAETVVAARDDAAPAAKKTSAPDSEASPDLVALLAEAAEAGQGRHGGSQPLLEETPAGGTPAAPAIGEQTRLFMRRAGVTRRNPPWKIALFVIACIALPISALYLLTQLSIVKLDITTVDEATGEAVQASVFSSGGLSGLRDMLLGKEQKPAVRRAAKSRPAAQARPAASAAAADEGPIVQRPTIEFNSLSADEHKSAAEIYQDGSKKIADPHLRKEKTEIMAVDGASGSLDAKVINAAVSKNLRAFQTCNEGELKRNPNFKGGKVRITFTIGPSGTVTRASLDRSDIDGTALGACLKEKAKRVVFPSFEGEPFDVEIPLVLTASM